MLPLSQQVICLLPVTTCGTPILLLVFLVFRLLTRPPGPCVQTGLTTACKESPNMLVKSVTPEPPTLPEVWMEATPLTSFPGDPWACSRVRPTDGSPPLICRVCSRTPGGGLKSQIVPNPVHTVCFPMCAPLGKLTLCIRHSKRSTVTTGSKRTIIATFCMQ